MKTIRENIATIVAGVVVAVAITLAFALFGPWRSSNDTALTAVIHDSDGNEQRLSLSEDATLEVVTSAGRNVVVVQDGAARIVEADCPNGSCMQQQPISRPGQQLICLPHRLWVEVIDQDSGSSELDESAVAWTDEDANPTVDLVAR